MNAYSFIFSDVIEHNIKFKEVDNVTVPGSKILTDPVLILFV